MSQVSEEDITQAANILSKLEPGLLPVNIFLQIARLCVTSIIELVPLRIRESVTEVLLLQRPADDPNWPGMLHTPGTVIRATDASDDLSTPFNRLYADELETTPTNQPVFVDTTLHQVTRGVEFAAVYYVDLGDLESSGEWYPAHQLPNNIVNTQQAFIISAVEAFERSI